MEEKLQLLAQRATEIDELMGRPEVAADHEQLTRLAKERAELTPVVTSYAALQSARKDLSSAQELARDADPEMAAMARDEVVRLSALREDLEEQLRLALVPHDPNDNRNVIMEIRAGTGGDEAALFAADLFRMYQRYTQRHGLLLEVVDSSLTEGGGIKELVAEVQGDGAYRLLKHESGVHRVQRVPTTETQGRIHTSTATVAVLPEAEEVDVDINPAELRMDIFHSGGPGGQNVNKVATAIRLVHIPTGIMVVSQDERSQLKNKQKAMTVMRTRLLERKQREHAEQTSAERRSQVGSGERSEKVRTYNFPQDRLTDHRISLTVHGLEGILAGGIDDVVVALLADEQARLLQEATA
ncbi:MAG: peptide chain release factor 1 [Chloroflexota bacterium]